MSEKCKRCGKDKMKDAMSRIESDYCGACNLLIYHESVSLNSPEDKREMKGGRS